jgi:gliding motility-associated lipoprotein GldH
MNNLENSYWTQNNSQQYQVEISDPGASYSLYYLIRYTEDYPYYNIWINKSVINDKQQMISKKLQGADLFNGKTGEPNGSGFGNTFDYEILSDSALHFPQIGTYTIALDQYMRQDTLKGVIAVGIKLKKN